MDENYESMRANCIVSLVKKTRYAAQCLFDGPDDLSPVRARWLEVSVAQGGPVEAERDARMQAARLGWQGRTIRIYPEGTATSLNPALLEVTR